MGLLSQAVANLVAAEQRIKALPGLPTAAQQVQSESLAAISPLVPPIQTLQAAVSSFTQTAIPQLKDVETMISSNQSAQQIAMAIANVQGEASTLKPRVDGVLAQVQTVSSQVFGSFNQLANIESGLLTQVAGLQGQLSTARSEEAAAQKRLSLIRNLGTLAVALRGGATEGAVVALLLKLQSDVNTYEEQLSSLTAQINALNQLRSATQQLGADLRSVVTKVSGVQNSVNFLTSEVMNIISDLSSGASLSAIGILVNAAITESTTLSVDAS
jgi:hypothetical protein